MQCIHAQAKSPQLQQKESSENLCAPTARFIYNVEDNFSNDNFICFILSQFDKSEKEIKANRK